MRKPLLSLEEFIKAHNQHNTMLKGYMLDPRSRGAMTDEIFDDLRDVSARSLKATNAKARIAVARRAHALFSEQIKARPRQAYSFVTLAPVAFSVPLEKARSVFLRGDLTNRVLKSVHY